MIFKVSLLGVPGHRKSKPAVLKKAPDSPNSSLLPAGARISFAAYLVFEGGVVCNNVPMQLLRMPNCHVIFHMTFHHLARGSKTLNPYPRGQHGRVHSHSLSTLCIDLPRILGPTASHKLRASPRVLTASEMLADVPWLKGSSTSLFLWELLTVGED